MTKKEKLAWAAGFFDGEGCFYVRTERKNGLVRKYVCACVVQTEKSILDKFQQIVGCGKVYTKTVKHKRYKKAWTLQFQRMDDVTKLVKLLWTWLGRTKRQQYKYCLKIKERRNV